MNKNKQIVILVVVIILIAFAAFFFIKKSNLNNVNQKQEDGSLASSPIVATVEVDQMNQSMNVLQKVIPKKIFDVGSELETDSIQLATGEWLSLSTGDYIMDYGHYYAFGNSSIKKEANELVRLEKMYSSSSSCDEKSVRCGSSFGLVQIGNDKFSEKMYDLLFSELSNEKVQKDGYRQY